MAEMPSNNSMTVLQTIGNYDLLEKIAEGGMGAIYKGRQRLTGQIVAVKIMPPHMANNPVLLKRFEQEFRAASRLDHPNIVRALDYGDNGTSPYLVMEFVEGESLGQKLERDGPMTEADAIRLIAQVAQGLHRAHKQGLIHRDVKPDNILITADNQAKLADLGLVKEVEADLNLTRTGRGLGTPHFMAPEQFRNAKNANVQCDIYSLGATLYVMLTNELPFRSSNGPLDAWMKKIQNDLTPPRSLVSALSERVDWAIRRAMSAAPEQRPATCREFVEDLTGRSTRKISTAAIQAAADLWYLVYKDDEGETHTVKGNTQAIRRSLREGLLGDASNVRASRSKSGPFEALRGYPEFRDMIVEPAAVSVAPAAGSGVVTPTHLTPATTQPRPTPPGADLPTTAYTPANAPHIALEPDVPAPADPRARDWVMWVLLLGVALLGALIAFYFLRPH
jgi:eukaryotic-like serine/threonine-protein kinase